MERTTFEKEMKQQKHYEFKISTWLIAMFLLFIMFLMSIGAWAILVFVTKKIWNLA